MNFENWMWLLRCPTCRGELTFNPASCACDDCGKTFPVHFGIPDFRLFCPSDSGYMSKAEDLKVSTELFDLHDKLSFEELARIKIKGESGHMDQNIQDSYVQWRLDNHTRAMRLTQWIQDRGIAGQDPANNVIGLDIGCGSGTGIATLLEIVETVVGFGLAISDLLLARKFLKEYYPDRDYLLFAGIAEQMSLASDVFSYVLARDVIEHVVDQEKLLQETHRVMNSGGKFLFNTGSRFVLLEPHTRLPVVGYLPRPLQPLYVRLVRKSEYKVHLPSLRQLRKWLNKSAFSDKWKIIASKHIDSTSKPKPDQGKAKRLILNGLRKLGLLKVLNRLLAHISYYEVIVEK